MTMRCPVCQDPLIGVEREQVEVEYCPGCRGLWFEDAELRLLAEATGRPGPIPHPEDLEAAAATDEAVRPCPRCDGKMEKVYLDRAREIVVDRCARGDGIWFDAGELGRFLAAARRNEDSGRQALAQFLGESFGASEHGS